MNSIRAVIDWLVDGARSAPLAEDMIAELCRRMVACDLPLWRVAVFVRSLHPDVAGRRFVWCPESGVSTSELSFNLFESDEFRASPVATIYDTCGNPLGTKVAPKRKTVRAIVIREAAAEWLGNLDRAISETQWKSYVVVLAALRASCLARALACLRARAREKSLKNFRLVPLRRRYLQRRRALAVIMPIMPTSELVWLVRQ